MSGSVDTRNRVLEAWVCVLLQTLATEAALAANPASIRHLPMRHQVHGSAFVSISRAGALRLTHFAAMPTADTEKKVNMQRT